MQRVIRTGLGLLAVLTFAPAFADSPVNSSIMGGDNYTTSLPPVLEKQAQGSQPADTNQAKSPDQNEKKAGAASGEPDHDKVIGYSLQDRWYERERR